MRVLTTLVALAGCVGDEDVAYLQGLVPVHAVIDDDTPSRTWEVRVETNADALRDGPTWSTVNLNAYVIVDSEGPGPFNALWVDAVLTGDDEATASLAFTGPSDGPFGLIGRYQADCVVGEPCAWTYPFVVTRREGAGGVVAIDFDARVLVTLGPESLAPDDAALSVEVVEVTRR